MVAFLEPLSVVIDCAQGVLRLLRLLIRRKANSKGRFMNEHHLANTDWLLLTLSSSRTGRMTPVQIQKSLFILSKEAHKLVGRKFYQFEPYDYGPFDAAIYHDLESLARDGAILADRVPGQRWSTYSVTPKGERQAKAAKQRLDSKTAQYVKRVVDWVTGNSFPDLIRAIYARYPEYKANSVFNG